MIVPIAIIIAAFIIRDGIVAGSINTARILAGLCFVRRVIGKQVAYRR